MDHRGSRKHVLDLTSSGEGPRILTDLLSSADAVVLPSSRMRPVGHDDSTEWDVRRFCRECPPPGADLGPLRAWWVNEDYRGPTWDLLAECSMAGRPGVLLVEAKAHETELDRGGKAPGDAKSDQSGRNHQTIAESLASSEAWYKASVHRSCRISVDSHYQLSNRLSAAEVLASCGVPVILLYLGFIGDTYFKSDYLRDDAHWQRVMGTYLDGVVPLWWPGVTTPHQQGGTVTMLIRSIRVRAASAPR